MCLASISSEFFFLYSVIINIVTAPHREVNESHEGPHLTFTNMGDGQNPAFLCYSQVGRVDQGDGQVINLGAPECLAVGIILHETLHALGKIYFLKRQERNFSLFCCPGQLDWGQG